MLARMSLLAALALAAATGCDRDAPGGMPPASEWKPPAPKASKVEGGRRGAKRPARGSASHQMVPQDETHAGVEAEGDEGAAAGDEEEDPHGPDPGHGEEQADEEADEPEADRGPRETVARGQISAAGEAAEAVKPGDVLYVTAVPIDADSGQPKGSAIAVDRFEVTELPMPFELAASPYEGDVVITAWTDADGEARTREPGDAEGRVRARLPADKVDLVLDTVLK
jgi:hypothetical protein